MRNIPTSRVPCEVTSVDGFVCLVVQFITHGYYFWVQGKVQNKRGLSAAKIDEKMVRKFNANLPKHRRPRERHKGRANVRYIRLGVDWFLFATYGQHKFFEEHRAASPNTAHQFHDIRDETGVIRLQGYAISLSRRGYAKKSPEERAVWQTAKAEWQQRRETRSPDESFSMLPRGRRHERWVGRVAIHRERYAELRAELLSLATHRQADYLAMRFRTVPFLPFKPVQQQLRSLFRQVNKARKHVGYKQVPQECIRTFFHNVSPFQQSPSTYSSGFNAHGVPHDLAIGQE